MFVVSVGAVAHAVSVRFGGFAVGRDGGGAAVAAVHVAAWWLV